VSATHFALPDYEGELHPSPPLGYFEFGWHTVYTAHRLVELLCAPTESVGPLCDHFRELVQGMTVPEPGSAMPSSLDRYEARVGPAGVQAMIAWALLNYIFSVHKCDAYQAVLRRPVTLSMLCQWIAHTPNFGPMDPSCSSYMPEVYCTRVEQQRWSYTGDCKDPNNFKSMRGGTFVTPPGGVPALAPLCISSPQLSHTYLRVRWRAFFARPAASARRSAVETRERQRKENGSLAPPMRSNVGTNNPC
jgi:hypothetical protein